MVQIGYEGAGSIDIRYERTILDISQPGKIVFDGKCFIGSGSRICVKGNLHFGCDCRVTGRSEIICYKEIKFGDESLISWDCIFMDTDFHKIFVDNKITNTDMGINLGKKVWIGCRVTVLKGSVIPTGSVIGAGSLVCKPLECTNVLYVGVPAVKVKDGIYWSE